ncbi:MAG: PEP-CTERM sorting domain-containing protein, partial [Dechloromonas sp.]
MLRHSVLAVLLAVGAQAASADTIVQWNFNSVVADASTGTGSTLTAVGNGTASLLGVTGSFASGTANGGSSDPAASDNSGWQTTGYAAQGSGNLTRGVQFTLSTAGYENIVFSYDLRHSNTSSRYETVQYSIDGINFTSVATFDGNAGDTWFKNRSVDLSSFADVADASLLTFLVVAAFAPESTA